MLNLRLLGIVLRRSGTLKVLVLFAIVYLLCALMVVAFEPSVTTFFDAVWLMWAVSTTVGLGDITAVTMVGRVATAFCSLAGILTTAVLTGVVVDFLNELRQKQFDRSMAEFLDKLERLPELSESELEAISQKVRAMRK